MRSTRRTRKGRNFEDNNTRLRTNVKAVGRFTKRGRADSNITANHEVRKRAKGTDTIEDVAEVATKEDTHDFGYSLRELKTASSFVKEKFLEASGVLMIPSTFQKEMELKGIYDGFNKFCLKIAQSKNRHKMLAHFPDHDEDTPTATSSEVLRFNLQETVVEEIGDRVSAQAMHKVHHNCNIFSV
ncbi:hypothetical protein CEUSTIGMA_g9759.t1 [Chlamydomonas eustigma]|uniref:Uncharacterized protein n=1 Tax=Chlamydomonas eustigma TaxID=1157962 RepID=A0A250XHQ5_9CHLO|nr:hypothetical protein CEUSTIGMA_g9759.t1 [Chlamydomonas eustigma]|eukprot:GAX82330.1 hypothetical protein CEUSTIGMA_g9759.t1 [Chlamydomonas eustigma]